MDGFRSSVPAPAKINLSLRVVGRRADGYHEIDSIFVPLDFADEVEVVCEPGAATTIDCRCAGRPELDGPRNLAARAAATYLQRIGVAARVQVRITKRIWTAAGLGGGSSDAAAVLRALNAHFSGIGVGLDPPDLQELALALGADVPFFLDPVVARARGVGERLSPVRGCPELDLVLVNPGTPLGTAEVYQALGLDPGASRPDVVPQPEQLDGSLHSVVAAIGNDLEPAAVALCPQIARLEQHLRAAGALAASMSGSGPTVFGIFPDRAAAERAALDMSSIPNRYSLYARGGSGLTLGGRSNI